jgi:hypothetical protein
MKVLEKFYSRTEECRSKLKTMAVERTGASRLSPFHVVNIVLRTYRLEQVCVFS